MADREVIRIRGPNSLGAAWDEWVVRCRKKQGREVKAREAFEMLLKSSPEAKDILESEPKFPGTVYGVR